MNAKALLKTGGWVIIGLLTIGLMIALSVAAYRDCRAGGFGPYYCFHQLGR